MLWPNGVVTRGVPAQEPIVGEPLEEGPFTRAQREATKFRAQAIMVAQDDPGGPMGGVGPDDVILTATGIPTLIKGIGILGARLFGTEATNLALTTAARETNVFGSEVTSVANSSRDLRLPATDSELTGSNTLGYTLPNGEVFIQPGLSRAEQVLVLRHEGVHSFLSVSDDAVLAAPRQSLAMWGYKNSDFLRFTEEALAEGIATRSVMQGLKHPIVNGYEISIPRLIIEPSTFGGVTFGAGYYGYKFIKDE